jgi:hypothetical protein
MIQQVISHLGTVTGLAFATMAVFGFITVAKETTWFKEQLKVCFFITMGLALLWVILPVFV